MTEQLAVSDFGSQDVIRAFARTHRLRTKTDACGELIIPSRKRRFTGCHIYQHSMDGKVFGAIFVGVGSDKLPRSYWDRTKVALQDAGCTIAQNTGEEGTVLFDPSNRVSSGACLKFCKITPRRTVSPEEREILVQRLAQSGSLK